MNTSTFIAMPTYLAQMTGIAYLRVGVRKVHVAQIGGEVLSIPRKYFPKVLPDGNAVAFIAARIVADGPDNAQVQS